MASMDLQETIENTHAAVNEIIKGNPEPMQRQFSPRDDVSLANPFGPAAVGRKQVVETLERAASQMREGEPNRIERLVKVVTPDLAFTVENERTRMKLGGSPDLAPIALRVTTIFRREEDGWQNGSRTGDGVEWLS